MYFVVYYGDLKKDPLNQGCLNSSTFQKAQADYEMLKNKGYKCYCYKGELITIYRI